MVGRGGGPSPPCGFCDIGSQQPKSRAPDRMLLDYEVAKGREGKGNLKRK